MVGYPLRLLHDCPDIVQVTETDANCGIHAVWPSAIVRTDTLRQPSRRPGWLWRQVTTCWVSVYHIASAYHFLAVFACVAQILAALPT